MTDVSLSKAAARGAMTTLGGQWIRFVVQTLSVIVLARLLTPQDYGLVAMATAVSGLALLLGDFGLSLASIQSQTITHQQRSNIFWINLGVGLAISGIVFGLAYPMAAFYGQPEVALVAMGISPMFLLENCASQFRAECSRNLRFKWMAAADIISQTAGLAAAVIVALSGSGFWALVVQQVGISLVRLIVLVIAARWAPTLPRRAQGMGALYTFGLNTLGVQFVNYLSSNVDNILVGKVYGADALGMYSRAYQLFRLPMQQVAAPMTRVALPILSKIEDQSRFNAYVERAQLLLTYVLGGAFMLATAFALPIVSIVLGSQWTASAPIFAVLAAGGVFQGIGYVYYWVFLAKALTGLQLRYAIISRLLMIALMVAGLPFGPIGVAAGASTGLALNWIILTIFAIPKAGIDAKSLAAQAIVPILVYLPLVAALLPLSYLWNDALGSWGLLGALSGIAIVYLVAVWLTIPRVRQDLRLLTATARLIRNR